MTYNFGLIGKNIDYSFSQSYFQQKFDRENLPHTYRNFDLQNLNEFQSIIENNENLKGLNITIPYKESIMSFLNKIDKKAALIGAVNTIKIHDNGFLEGFNTDYIGFTESIKPYLKSHHTHALILGTGGASKAVEFALKKLNISYYFVSRSPSNNKTLLYSELNKNLLSKYSIIINCTPLGTYPNIQNCPDISFDNLSNKHLLFDLIYNPKETKFMTLGKLKGATVCNGMKMLELQADKAWDIWNL
ncbi:shikimate dehydrogenase [Flavobacteriaceae bacterium]|jgi:shikimate dehydrogenase|nr:shikimate dehydrogenase [Flavobacteriaceae bacterium]